MKNDIEILKLFTRKLANCKYSIPADKLTRYLKDGGFGYSFDKANDKIVTNDAVFADEVIDAVENIRAIFSEPHIALKQEEAIRNISVASEIDTHALTATLKDEKLWKVKLGKARPEFVHTYVREDNLAIYENRFISFLVDYLYENVSKKLLTLCGDITTFNKKIDGNGNAVAYPQNEYVGYTEKVESVPVLAQKSDPQIAAIGSLFKAKTVLNSLKNYEIYKACKKAGFDERTLKPTNILLEDKNYNRCYKFYLSYLQSKDFYTTQSKMYSQFVFINLMAAITDCGFEFAKDSKDILINENAELKAERINFNKGIFNLALSYSENGDAIIDATELADGSSAKYLFKVISDAEIKNLGKPVAEYATELNEKNRKEFTRVFVISDEKTESENTVHVAAGDASVLKNLTDAVKTITVLAEGVEYIHSRYCPVCGTTLIAPDNGDFVCSCCESLYHVFRYENRDLIWIKRLPVSSEKKAVTDDIPVITEHPQETVAEDLAVTETEDATDDTDNLDATEIKNKRRVLLKSFTGKMSQATKEQKAYYNELKNYLLSYKRVNSRTSWHFDSFNIGRNKAVKIAFRGRTMVAFFALDPKKYENTKYYPRDVSDKKKFVETPMMVKIKSQRGVKFAKELVDTVCAGLSADKNFIPQTYKFTRMSDKRLIENGLAKEMFVNIKR